MSTNKSRKLIGYRPDDEETRKWLDRFSGDTKGRSTNQLMDIAVKFLRAWPEDELFKILGRSSLEELKEYANYLLSEKKQHVPKEEHTVKKSTG